ncbi:MAG: hypothetical protein C4527_28875 [Candidatus Omnitrophota bacterium]|jgi:hypothetical protein|nr:MAG: hypothetical protein C4527_28875 [Candidatus Omnitrophota bacterium]
MRKLPRHWIVSILFASWIVCTIHDANADTANLELKRLDVQSRYAPRGDDADFLFRAVNAQFIMYQPGSSRSQQGTSEFSAIVKKEPEKYESDLLFREVVKLGSNEFAFVFDSSDLKANGFDRLYFDKNHNGDLTDDEVIQAMPKPENVNFGEGSSLREFPRIDVKLNADGTEYEYSFNPMVYSNTNTGGSSLSIGYAYVQFYSSAYRDGEMTLDGKKHRIILLDFNSNGRFDDPFTVRDDIRMSGGRIYPQNGDMLLIDPDLNDRNMRGYGVSDRKERRHVSKLVLIEDRFYDLNISPSGDKIELTEAKIAVGYVTNPNIKYDAVAYGDKGFIKFSGIKDSKSMLPDGDWRLLEYKIDATETGQGNSSLTFVSAAGTKECPVVTVEEGKTVVFPFGPPYKPQIEVSGGMQPRGGSRSVQLGMNLVGSVGEYCTNLMVNGDRPPDPSFVIATKSNEIIERGKFEYG